MGVVLGIQERPGSSNDTIEPPVYLRSSVAAMIRVCSSALPTWRPHTGLGSRLFHSVSWDLPGPTTLGPLPGSTQLFGGPARPRLIATNARSKMSTTPSRFGSAPSDVSRAAATSLRSATFTTQSPLTSPDNLGIGVGLVIVSEVGVGVALGVGVGVGKGVGARSGAAVGAGEGVAVGAGEGVAVGAGEGVAVGAGEGVGVGCVWRRVVT